MARKHIVNSIQGDFEKLLQDNVEVLEQILLVCKATNIGLRELQECISGALEDVLFEMDADLPGGVIY